MKTGLNMGGDSGSSESTISTSESLPAGNALDTASDSVALAGPMPPGPASPEKQDEPKPEPELQKEAQKQPAPRPVPVKQSQSQPQAASHQTALDEYLERMRKLFDEQNKRRQSWQRPSNRNLNDTLKALQNTNIPKLLFKLYRQHGMSFLNMPADQQLNIVKKVANELKEAARQLHTPASSARVPQPELQPDLNDLTNPLNMQRALESGDSVVSQNAAAQNGAVQAQNNEVAEEVLVEDQQQLAREHGSDMNSAAAVITLTAEEINDIDEHNQAHHASTPRPEPQPNTNASQREEEEHNEASKIIKHETEEVSAEDLAKHANAEKHALKAVIEGDKEAFIDAAKGIEKTVESGLEHAAGSALPSLVASAA